jgi:hypothetical protein
MGEDWATAFEPNPDLCESQSGMEEVGGVNAFFKFW